MVNRRGRLQRVLEAIPQLSLGLFEVDEVELVRTDKVLSGAGTRTLGRFRLGQAPVDGGPTGRGQPG